MDKKHEAREKFFILDTFDQDLLWCAYQGLSYSEIGEKYNNYGKENVKQRFSRFFFREFDVKNKTDLMILLREALPDIFSKYDK